MTKDNQQDYLMFNPDAIDNDTKEKIGRLKALSFKTCIEDEQYDHLRGYAEVSYVNARYLDLDDFSWLIPGELLPSPQISIVDATNSIKILVEGKLKEFKKEINNLDKFCDSILSKTEVTIKG